MAMTPSAAAATGGPTVAPAPFLFRRRSLILSYSASSPRSVLWPRRITPIAMRSLRHAYSGIPMRLNFPPCRIWSDCRRFIFLFNLDNCKLALTTMARLSAMPARRHGGVVAAASAAASPHFSAGRMRIRMSPFDGFDKVKMAYKRKQKEAENSKDAEFFIKLERAYNTVMMEQLHNRKKGLAYGSIQVSKDIKYADNQPIVSWGPRYSRSTKKDLHINLGISTAFIMCTATMAHSDWKPLQFLCFAYFYRILEKLKATEPAIAPIYNEYGEVQGRGIHMANQVLRSLGLVLGSILATSLGYTGLANLSQFFGQYIPSIVYNFQELIVTTASSVLLCILASYYR
ncbi:hypothetical protein EJB05_21990 [Eragrostis curvula]|uniref:Uncharacterized protein n=1 Tax=Eragrostis curvula TaxID=38414 RepID=A0A5J9V4C0_9POAL|nr:hypothetical protein EJB05_21990 [Eragrostis curvula]